MPRKFSRGTVFVESINKKDNKEIAYFFIWLSGAHEFWSLKKYVYYFYVSKIIFKRAS